MKYNVKAIIDQILYSCVILYFFSTVTQATADIHITHVFKDGDVIQAESFNQNFNDIAAASLPTDCQAGEIIKWDGDSWRCAADTIIELKCDQGQRPIFDEASEWICQ